jgi:site-specific DNA-methyltransferase (adenine-specific)
VYDPFLGSGTTLVAAENEGRRCWGVEVERGYVGVVLQRYLDAFGIRGRVVEDEDR